LRALEGAAHLAASHMTAALIQALLPRGRARVQPEIDIGTNADVLAGGQTRRFAFDA